jgi:DamX protein
MKAEREPRITVEEDGDILLEHYQFSHDPFMARTPGFKFFTPQRKNVLAQLHHLARFSEQLLAVVGPLGAGKSLLRQALVASSNKDAVQSVVMSGREVRSTKALLAFIGQATGASANSEEQVLERAEALFQTGITLHLVVDDAQLLETPALQVLADLSQIGEKYAPRVFVFGDEELAGHLDQLDAPSEESWLHVIELQPYSLEETRDYLAQRLEAAGQGIELLDDEQLSRIHRASGGWPGKINEQGRQVMLDDLVEEVRPGKVRSSSPLPLRSLVALVLVGLGVAAAWMMGDRTPEPTRTVLQLPEPVVEVQVSTAPGAGPEAILVMPGDEEMMEAVSSAPEDIELVQIESPVVASPPPAEVAAPVAAEVPRLPPPPAATTSTPPESPVQVVVPPVRPAPAAPAAAPAQVAVAPSTAGARGADWYRQRPASEFTLQLLGTRSRQAAADFVSRHSGVQDIGYFETRHEGQPWFVVTQGAYASRQQAQQGVAALPEALRNQKPWPRSMASIQQSLP